MPGPPLALNRQVTSWTLPVDLATAHIKPYEVRLIAVSTMQPMSLGDGMLDRLWADPSAVFSWIWGMPTSLLAEANTHRAQSRGAASARAIPPKTFAEEVKNYPVWPMRPGKNNAGMQSNTRLTEPEENMLLDILESARDYLVGRHAEINEKVGVHKQVANRLLDSFSYKPQLVTCVGGAPLMNLLWTRTAEGADPGFRVQALELWRQLRSLRLVLSGCPDLRSTVALKWSRTFEERISEPSTHLPFVSSHETWRAVLDANAERWAQDNRGVEPLALVPQEPHDRCVPQTFHALETYYDTDQVGGIKSFFQDHRSAKADVWTQLMLSTGRAARVSTRTHQKATLVDDFRLGVQIVTGHDLRVAPLPVRSGGHVMHPSPTEHQAVTARWDRARRSNFTPDWPENEEDFRKLLNNEGYFWLQHRKCLQNEQISGAVNDPHALAKEFDNLLMAWDADER